MKVICFTDKYQINPYVPKIPVGSCVTVVNTFYDRDGGYYNILEYPKNSKGEDVSYCIKQFIPLSDICETELAKQREELVTVNN